MDPQFNKKNWMPQKDVRESLTKRLRAKNLSDSREYETNGKDYSFDDPSNIEYTPQKSEITNKNIK